jgi:hypothetical protein
VKSISYKIRRPAALMGAAAALTMLVTVGISTSSANATTGCHANGCGGYDPVVMGCSVTSTTSQVGALATVWNRYSFGCDSNWARAQLTAAAVAAGDTMWVSIDTFDSTNNEESICWPNYPSQNNTGDTDEFCNDTTGPYGGSSVVYTDMVDGTDATNASVAVFDAQFDLLAVYTVDQ